MNNPERLRSAVRWLTWFLVATAVFFTLSPVEWRPSLSNDNVERFGALFVLGLLLGLGYPKALGWVTLAMVVGPALLEFAQSFAPGRHGHPPDVVWKTAGGLLGCAVAHLLNRRLDAKRATGGA